MRYLIAALCLYASILTYYSVPYAKHDATVYTTAKLENMITALNGKPSLRVKMDEELVSAMPPPMNISEIAANYPASDSDVIRQILGGAE